MSFSLPGGSARWKVGRASLIVGTRRCTPDGADLAYQLAYDLSSAGVCVVSGLALGVDGAAHAGALAAVRELQAGTLTVRPGRRLHRGGGGERGRRRLPQASYWVVERGCRPRSSRLGDPARMPRTSVAVPVPQPGHRRSGPHGGRGGVPRRRRVLAHRRRRSAAGHRGRRRTWFGAQLGLGGHQHVAPRRRHAGTRRPGRP